MPKWVNPWSLAELAFTGLGVLAVFLLAGKPLWLRPAVFAACMVAAGAVIASAQRRETDTAPRGAILASATCAGLMAFVCQFVLQPR